MYEKQVDCIYFDYAPCKCTKLGNRGKKCHFESDKLCKMRVGTKNTNQVFDKQVWFYKTAMDQMQTMLDKMFRKESYEFSRSRKVMKQCDNNGHYHFIGRPVQFISNMVVHIRKYFGDTGNAKPKFLDCGAGVGNVVLMAHFAGFDAYGIEYNRAQLERGWELLAMFGVENPKKHLLQGDILLYPDYDKYDVLYAYCPMKNGKKERAFENKLKLDMRIGALLTGIGFNGSGREQIGKHRVYFQHLMLNDSSEYNFANPWIKVAHEKR